MQTKFTPSTNIIRDASRELTYIPTPNSVRIVGQLGSDFKRGIRSFNIIGSYGTGKSSFLWALQQTLRGKKKYFNLNWLQTPKLDIINFVGEFKSISIAFADFFELPKSKRQSEHILAEIFNYYHDLGRKNPLLVIIIDEFGKYLEYASQNDPEKELYFIQQLSEFVNNPDHNILLITSVHQNFDAYSYSLNNTQKQEWTKVKGRFREITFNEPIEQLLFLASEHLKLKQVDKATENNVKSILTLVKKSKAYNINPDYATEIATKLYPLDFFAANILTITLQKYGQNERSLFSFLESTDHTGINSFDKKSNPFYNISCVYDYLTFNFYSFINSRYNPDFASWATIRNSLEAIEKLTDTNLNEYSKILKSIGLLHITASNGADIGKDLLEKYSSVCLGISNAGKLIENLEKWKIILYRNYSKRYILFEGTDLDISTALIEAGNKVNDIVDVVSLLNREYQLPPIFAKSYSYLNGTPRTFEFRISDSPIQEIPKDETDGFINLIFNEKLSISDVKKASLNQKEAIIYGFYQNSKTIKNQLFEIEKTRKVIDENRADNIAFKELSNILLHQQNLLNHYILNNLYSKKADLKWIYNGEELLISSKKDFNRKLSGICGDVYAKTPTFRNELVNKQKISNSIHTAKKNYYRALVDNWDKQDLGFEDTKFPPEKTIYLTLLKANGIQLYSDNINHTVQVTKGSTFIHLWKYSEEFLESAKHQRRTISDFISTLTRRPFKIKQGLIDFWVASFLFIKRDDYALFGESGYIPYLTDEILDLIIKFPGDYAIKSFDIAGVKLDLFNSYRIFLNQDKKSKPTNLAFIETIKPFLTFYKELSEYSKNTKRLRRESLAIRDAIANSKDPEKTFFEDFPAALGYSIAQLQNSKDHLQSYTIKLQDSIRELRTSYDSLINRFEDFILEEYVGKKLEFEDYRTKLQNRYRKLKKHLCLPHQKIFLQRMDSQIEDRKAWLNSLAQVIINKPLLSLRDEEEILLYDKFKAMIFELDSLTNISDSEINDDSEEILGIELSSFIDGIQKRLVRLPKNKMTEVSEVEDLVRSKLSRDRSINIAAITGILKELIAK